MNVSSAGSRIKGVATQLDSQKSTIDKKAYESQNYWTGDAQKAFSTAHKEVQSTVVKGNNTLSVIGSKLNSLQSSIDAAERDIQRKKREKLMAK